MTEVKALLGVQLKADRVVEVLVRDLAVLVDIEVVEDTLKVFFGNVDTPEVEVKLELVLADETSLFHVQVAKGFPEGLPLKLDFLKDLELNVLVIVKV